MSDETEKKRSRGRPVEKEWPELIPDMPENVMLALLNSAPRDEGAWKYLRTVREDGTG